ncbi:DNA alkylation repair protein [Duganella vulcania]|uniref:DNA alkylation repair protein n=1 Tax=Duganella vulcania TaxID=2692166 RepID=A0A845GJ73_9BURK|nr:DNA alkylation repair protein [Duganella vulcania]MYM93482.1 DNA alkylation repair protein [Duganella vulcania]
MNAQFHADLDTALASAVTPGRAPAMRAYMRDQFPFLGIATPQRRQATRILLKSLQGSSAKDILQYAEQFWQRPEREYQYVAADLLSMHSKILDISHVPVLLELAQKKSWWDSVDPLASVIGKILRFGHEGMDQALLHDNMWVRRIALLHQLGWREKTDKNRLFNYSVALAHEKEFFIQKAIGWALRDYARHDPEAVRAFILKEKQQLSKLSYREANKHFGDN